MGNYKFSITDLYSDPEEEVIYDSSAAAPPMRLSMGAAKGPWKLKAYATAWGVGEGEVDADWWGEPTSDETTYGLVSDFGADVSYLFNIGPILAGPSVGFRNSRITAGYRYAAEGGFTGLGYGIQTLGLRLGAEANASVGERISIGASLGVSPFLAATDHWESISYSPDYSDYVHDVWDELLIDLSKALSFDAGLAASFRVIPAVEITGGFQYMSTQVEPDPVTYPGYPAYSTSATVFYIGAKANFWRRLLLAILGTRQADRRFADRPERL
ncbi:MAG: hypothetical protein GX183_05150 [Firmicutes bacterium]|jgi:hypothetical protein|nr:hypothetical protein [Bacillota bacterium]